MVFLTHCISVDMELLYLFLILPILLILLFKKYTCKTKEKDVSQLPPGPWKLPIIGSMHHLVGSLPHHTLWRLAKRYGGLMHLQLGEISAIVISSPQAAKEIMKTHDIVFATRPYLIGLDIIMYGSTDLAGAPYGDYWRQLRKLCVVELFSAKRVQSFQLIREEEVYTLLHSISSTPGEVINLGEKILALSGDITARVAFGKKCKDKMRFMSAMKAVALLGGGFNLDDYFPSSRLVRAIIGTTSAFESLHVEIDKILNDIIKQHKEEKSSSTNRCEGEPLEEENFLDVLLRLQETGYLSLPLTLDNIKAIIVDIFTGGTETSSTTMEWVMSELMKCPNAMRRVQTEVREVLKGKEKVTEDDLHELHYLRLVIKETLRLHPPLPLLIPRECRETCEILGFKVPKATQVIVNAWALGRCTQFWDDAEIFMPERFEGSSVDFKGANFEFLPFGAGRRSCPGMMFGLATMELPLALLLYYFDWEFPLGMTPSELDMTENLGMVASKKSKLQLRAIPRVPLAF